MRSIQLSYGRVYCCLACCVLRRNPSSLQLLRSCALFELQPARFQSGGERGIRTLDGLLTYTPLAGARLRPLGHLSAAKTHRQPPCGLRRTAWGARYSRTSLWLRPPGPTDQLFDQSFKFAPGKLSRPLTTTTSSTRHILNWQHHIPVTAPCQYFHVLSFGRRDDTLSVLAKTSALTHLSAATINPFLRPGNMPPAPDRPFNFAADGDDLQPFAADVPGAEDAKYSIAALSSSCGQSGRQVGVTREGRQEYWPGTAP